MRLRLASLMLVAGLGVPWPTVVPGEMRTVASTVARLVLHTYEARIRLGGRVSTTRVQASDAGHAKRLVRAQYGEKVTVLSVKRVDDRR